MIGRSRDLSKKTKVFTPTLQPPVSLHEEGVSSQWRKKFMVIERTRVNNNFDIMTAKRGVMFYSILRKMSH